MLSSENKFDQLKAFYYFLVPSLSDASWEICENVLKVITFKKGALITRPGLMNDHVYFMNTGLVRMYFKRDDKDKNVCFFNENNYVCDYQSFIARRPGTMYIQALEETEVVATSYNNLQMLYREVPEANLLGRIIAEQLFIKMHDASAADAQLTLEQRYMQLVQETPWIIQRVPQYMIASLLGITPEALSRVKGRMQKTKKKPVLVA